MSQLLRIEEFGNQLAAVFDDNSKVMAYPTGLGQWLATYKSNIKPPPDTGGGGAGNGLFAWPFKPSLITDGYGYVPGHLQSKHHGIDFGVASGTPIPATKDGTAYRNDSTNGYGYAISIDHGVLPSGTHAGKQCYSMYAHMSAAGYFAPGAHVNQGDIVGPSGATGFVTGACMHWEIHITGAGQPMIINTTDIDPQAFMAEYGPQ